MGYPTFNPLLDVLSGTIMATTSIPQLIAYAESVGYSSYRGLSTAGVPLLVWGITTGHPYLNAGATSTTALMIRSDLHGDTYSERYGEDAYIQLVAIYTAAIALLSFVFAITGFGRVLTTSIPKTVRSGFRWGSSVGVLLSALPNGLLVHGSSELKRIIQQNTFYQQSVQPIAPVLPGLATIIQCTICLVQPLTVWGIEPTIIFFVGTAFVMYNGAQYCLPSFLAKIPGIEVILVTAMTAYYSASTNYSGAIVGTIPVQADNNNSDGSDGSGYKLFGILPIDFVLYDTKQIQTLVPLLIHQVGGGSIIQTLILLIMFTIVAFVSVVGLASGFEVDDGIIWDPSREMFALSITNAVSAVVGAAPVGGSLSRSLVARMTGTTSQLTCIVTALCWIYVLPYTTTILAPIPKAALSAIIVSAVLQGIIYPKELFQFWFDRHKIGGSIQPTIIAWTTGILTAITSPTQGFTAGLLFHLSVTYLFPTNKATSNDLVKKQ